MSRPASRTSVRSPRSLSSFAAHPPVIPEPTTMASYSFALGTQPSSALFPMPAPLAPRNRRVAVIPSGHHVRTQLLRDANARGVVAPHREEFEGREPVLVARLGICTAQR